jgi:hypothetical protein
MSQGRESKVGEITRKGDFYQISGVGGNGRLVKVDIPVTTLESMPRKAAEAFMKRSVHGVSQQES